MLPRWLVETKIICFISDVRTSLKLKLNKNCRWSAETNPRPSAV